MQSTYLTSAQKAHQLPNFSLPEIAFIGRSNCGKSSLLNALLGRKNLARSSSTPGRTQMVNFFSVELAGGMKLILADLPGYGYNVARRDIRELWDSLLVSYLERSTICEFLYLSDIRRDFEDFELEYMRHLGHRLPLTVVLTKADKVKAKDVTARQTAVKKQLTAARVKLGEVLVVSNLNKKGIEKLRELVFVHAKPASSASELASGDAPSKS